jgi:hypothetical protein
MTPTPSTEADFHEGRVPKNIFFTEESDIIIIAWFIYTFNSRLAELQRVYKQILIKITYNIIYINYPKYVYI